MQNTELIVTAALCLAGEDFHISMKNSGPTFAGTGVLVCGQSIVHNHFNSFLRRSDYV